MMKNQVLLFFLFLIPLFSRAQSIPTITYGIQAATYGAGALIANPPLPLLYMKAGDNRFAIQPGYVDGHIDDISGSPSGDFRTEGSFKGSGGAIAFNHALTNSLGFFVMGMGAQVKGDFSYSQASGCTGQCSVTSMNDITSSFTSLAAGVNWTFVGGETSDRFSAGLMIGPSYTGATMSERFVNTDSSGTTTDDFTLKTNPSFMTALLGLQVGFNLTDWLILNPYFLTNVNLNEDRCRDYEVTEERVHGTLAGRSTATCGGGSDSKIDVSGNFSSLGLNVIFPKIGLSFSAFTVPSAPTDVTMKALKVKAYVLSVGLEF